MTKFALRAERTRLPDLLSGGCARDGAAGVVALILHPAAVLRVLRAARAWRKPRRSRLRQALPLPLPPFNHSRSGPGRRSGATTGWGWALRGENNFPAADRSAVVLARPAAGGAAERPEVGHPTHAAAWRAACGAPPRRAARSVECRHSSARSSLGRDRIFAHLGHAKRSPDVAKGRAPSSGGPINWPRAILDSLKCSADHADRHLPWCALHLASLQCCIQNVMGSFMALPSSYLLEGRASPLSVIRGPPPTVTYC